MRVMFRLQFLAQQAEACGQDFCVLGLSDDVYNSRYDIVNKRGEHISKCPFAPFSKGVSDRPADATLHILGGD